MPRTRTRRPNAQKELIELFLQLPRQWQIAIGIAAALIGVLYLAGAFERFQPRDIDTPIGDIGTSPILADLPEGTRELVFAFWNVENLFDDKNEGDRRRTVDRPYDQPFADDADLRQLKLDRLADTILAMNTGNGPDILGVCEVESVRALELLQGTLNKRITDPKQRYVSIAMRNLDAGRHIAPGFISRLPLSQISTRLHGSRLRILETRLIVNGHPLILIGSHWTSQLRQMDGSTGDSGREKYASIIGDIYRNLYDRNPDVDVLVCGDWNTVPSSDEVVKELGAIGDRDRVKRGDGPPLLLNLMAAKPPEQYGTIYYNGKPLIYDQIAVSRGMLDPQGWSCDPDSVTTYTKGLIRTGATRREPWRFGDPGRNLPERERGFSDHFPVMVKLFVAPAATKSVD